MKNYAVAAILLISSHCWAQEKPKSNWLDQGQFQVGVGVGVGLGSSNGGYIRATPYAQYFLADRWALRVEGRYNYNGPDGNQYAGGGLLTQYHFVRTNRFSAFAQGGYFFGVADYGGYRAVSEYQLVRYRQQLNYGMLNIGLGAQYRLGSRWTINALAERNIGQKVGNYGTDQYNTTLGVGFRIK